MTSGSADATGETPRSTRLLIATAVAAEREAIAHELMTSGVRPDRVNAVVVGVGPVAAAVATTIEVLAAESVGRPYGAVVCAGIAGGVVRADGGGAPVGGLAVADRFVAADLGAASPEGFLPLDELGFGVASRDADTALTDRLAGLLAAAGHVVHRGVGLTVSTVTGTATRAAELRERYPDAVTEGMEGYGVATAADACGLPALELRAVSNLVGPRDRSTWHIGEALTALAAATGALSRLLAPARADER